VNTAFFRFVTVCTDQNLAQIWRSRMLIFANIAVFSILRSTVNHCKFSDSLICKEIRKKSLHSECALTKNGPGGPPPRTSAILREKATHRMRFSRSTQSSFAALKKSSGASRRQQSQGGGGSPSPSSFRRSDSASPTPYPPSYFARGSGRTWNFTIFGRVPLPPSWCHGVYIE
jgi:hypothetical protein